MSTRSHIFAKMSDGRVAVIYCHFDGYLEHNGSILKNYYNVQEKVEALIKLGDLSMLSKSTDCPFGHSYESRVNGYCVAYGRDRGEENTEAKYYDNLEMAYMSTPKEDYSYYWDGEKWTYCRWDHGNWTEF